VYCQLLPKKNVWLKYIKSKMKQPTKELVEAISQIKECSQREAKEEVILLDNDILEDILYRHGYQPDQVLKMFK
jgi:ribosomal protein L31E